MRILFTYHSSPNGRFHWGYDWLTELECFDGTVGASNKKLDTGLGQSKSWNNLDIDGSYRDWETSWSKFQEIEEVVIAAWNGKESDPQATLWHWAARCNKTWPISQFLKDPVACEMLMALDNQGNTALEVAIACGSTAAANMLQTYITKNNLTRPRTIPTSTSARLSSSSASSYYQPITPKTAWEYNDEGTQLFAKGLFQEALQKFEQALSVDPKYIYAHYNKGLALSNLGNYENAEQSYDNALSIDPSYSPAYSGKGDVHRHYGEYEAAIKCYREALRLDPSNLAVQECLQAVESVIQAKKAEQEAEARLQAEREKQERLRLAAEKEAKAKIEAQRVQAEQARLAAEKERARLEEKRIAAEKEAAAKIEAQRVAAEKERLAIAKEKSLAEEKRLAAESALRQKEQQVAKLQAENAAREKAERAREESRQQAERDRIAREARERRVKEETATLLTNATPNLFKSILAKNISGVELALTHGAEINAQDSEGFSPILRVAQTGNVQILNLLLAKGALIKAHRDTGRSALYEAAFHGHSDAFFCLIQNDIKGKLIKIKTFLDEETIWHACARGGSVAIAKHLYSLRLSLDVLNQKQQTPLMLAVIAGHEDLVDWFLKKHADWDPKDSFNKTALDYAKEYRHPEIHSALVEAQTQEDAAYDTPDDSDESDAAFSSDKTLSSSSNTSKPLSEVVSLSSSSSSSQLKQPAPITPGGGVHVQLTIPYSALTFGRNLGEGGFGAVYTGKYAHTDVAIKCIKSHNLTERALEQLKSESVFMVKLRHPHIVQCYGACLEPGHYSIVMELMPKGSLNDLLQNKQDIPWSLRAQIAVDIASGLAYLHDQQIVHRDLKSMNVLLSDSLRAKISDFGLSKIKTESQATSTNSKKAPIGTTRWMAPELFSDEPHNTFESDVYSLAVLLWEIAARKLPYEKFTTEVQVARQIEKGNKEIIPVDCPSELSTIISDCWKTAPRERLTSSVAHERLSSWCSLFSASSKSGTSSRSPLDSGVQAPQSSAPLSTTKSSTPEKSLSAEKGAAKPLAFGARPLSRP